MNTAESARKGATRRRHSAAFKRKLLDLSRQRGASVAAVALEHGINANLLFKWRRDETALRAGATSSSPLLLPVNVELVQTPAVRGGASRTASPGVIEVELGQARLRLRGCVDEATLRGLVRALREAA
jgi:transposase